MARMPMKAMPEMEDDEESGSSGNKKMELEITVYGHGPEGKGKDMKACGGMVKKAKGGLLKVGSAKKSGSKSGTGIDKGMKKFSPIARPQKFSGLY